MESELVPIKEADTELVQKGAFIESLLRNNRQIRHDRAVTLYETTQTLYRRAVEDLEIKLKQMRRDRDNMLDLSPNNVFSLELASNFDSKAFVEEDIDLGVRIRNTEIKLDIAKRQYNLLFGGA